MARALVGEPQLVLADEPTAALDGTSGREVVNLLQSLARERQRPILMVTHDARVLDIADRIIDMQDGRLKAESPAIQHSEQAHVKGVTDERHVAAVTV